MTPIPAAATLHTITLSTRERCISFRSGLRELGDDQNSLSMSQRFCTQHDIEALTAVMSMAPFKRQIPYCDKISKTVKFIDHHNLIMIPC